MAMDSTPSLNTTPSSFESGMISNPNSLAAYKGQSSRKRSSMKDTDRFPTVLHKMLTAIENNEDGRAKIVSWQPHGKCFLIKNKEDFINKVLPMWFSRLKYPTFERQLHKHGFRKLARKGPDQGGFYHPKFTREEPEIAKTIQHTGTRGRRGRKPNSKLTEPDFYDPNWTPPASVETPDASWTGNSSKMPPRIVSMNEESKAAAARTAFTFQNASWTEKSSRMPPRTISLDKESKAAAARSAFAIQHRFQSLSGEPFPSQAPSDPVIVTINDSDADEDAAPLPLLARNASVFSIGAQDILAGLSDGDDDDEKEPDALSTILKREESMAAVRDSSCEDEPDDLCNILKRQESMEVVRCGSSPDNSCHDCNRQQQEDMHSSVVSMDAAYEPSLEDLLRQNQEQQMKLQAQQQMLEQQHQQLQFRKGHFQSQWAGNMMPGNPSIEYMRMANNYINTNFM